MLAEVVVRGGLIFGGGLRTVDVVVERLLLHVAEGLMLKKVEAGVVHGPQMLTLLRWPVHTPKAHEHCRDDPKRRRRGHWDDSLIH